MMITLVEAKHGKDAAGYRALQRFVAECMV